MTRMPTRIITSGLAGAAMLLALPAMAVDADSDHEMNGSQSSGQAQEAAASPSSQAYEAASKKMHQNMSMTLSGDADVDFVRGMIAHHQGAIDMANVELKYGQDNEMKRLAKNIISAQKGEIKLMQRWLKAHQLEQDKNQQQ